MSHSGQTFSRFFLLLGLLSIISTSIFGQEFFRIGKGHRSMAMGNTGIASSIDGSAVFYNPAALANIRTSFWDLYGGSLEFTESADALYDDLLINKGLKFNTAAEADTFFQQYQDSYTYARLALASTAVVNFTSEGWTLSGSALEEAMVSMDVPLNVTDPLTLYQRWDSVRQAGVSIPIGVGRFVVGIGYKTIRRRLVDNYEYTIGSASFDGNFPGDASDDSGAGFDIGFLYRAATPWRLTFGLVAQNVGNIDLGDAGKEMQEVSAGVAVSPEWGIFRLTMALDYRDMFFNISSDTEYARRTHFGAELGIFPIAKTYSVLSVRVGYNQGYITKGAEVNLGHGMIVGLTQYSEETGVSPEERESKRTVYYLSFGF